MVEKHIQTSRGKICYLETEPNKKKLVFLHGGFGQPQTIERFRDLLEPEGFQLVAPYLPGHGKSFSLPKGFSYEDLVESMREFVEKAELTGTVALGHSLGGRLAFDLRDKFKSVVVVSPVFIPIQFSLFQVASALVTDHLKDMGIDEKRNITDLIANFINLGAIWKLIKSIPSVSSDGDLQNVMMFYGNRDGLLTFPLIKNLKTYEYDCGHYLYVAKYQQEIFNQFIGFIS